ncbi:hypothetical protein D3C79_1006210 [compost metagenome]
MAVQGLAGEAVDADFHRLPRAHVGQLGFFVVGDHVGLLQGYHGQQRLARHHVLAGAYAALADHARDRCADHGVLFVLLGQLLAGLRAGQRCRALLQFGVSLG